MVNLAEAFAPGDAEVGDGELLAEKLKELSLGVRTRLEEVVEVDADWFSGI